MTRCKTCGHEIFDEYGCLECNCPDCIKEYEKEVYVNG